MTLIAIYVDDILIACCDIQTTQIQKKQFQIWKIRPPEFSKISAKWAPVLESSFHEIETEIALHQKGYITDIL